MLLWKGRFPSQQELKICWQVTQQGMTGDCWWLQESCGLQQAVEKDFLQSLSWSSFKQSVSIYCMLWFRSWNPLGMDGTLLNKKAAGEFLLFSGWKEGRIWMNKTWSTEYVLATGTNQCYTEEPAEEPSQAHHRGSKIRGGRLTCRWGLTVSKMLPGSEETSSTWQIAKAVGILNWH